jgi:hypothetical protein
LFGEPATFSTDYKLSTGATFGVGGGYMFSKKIGAGANFSSAAFPGEATDNAHVPHPVFFNAYGDASKVSEHEVNRGEAAFNIHVMFVFMDSGKTRVRVYAGPSFIKFRQTVVENFFYTQTTNGTANNITITTSDVVDVKDSAWGFHVGGDYSYFFNRVFGVGGFARYIFGSTTIDNPLANPGTSTIDLKLGGLQAGGDSDCGSSRVRQVRQARQVRQVHARNGLVTVRSAFFLVR